LQVSQTPQTSSSEPEPGSSAEFLALLRPAERQRQLTWAITTAVVLALAAAGAIIAPDAAAITPKNASGVTNLVVFHFAGIGLGVFSLIIRTYTYSDRRVIAVLASQRLRVPAQLANPAEQSLWRLFRVTGPVQISGWLLNMLIMLLGVVAVYSSGNIGSITPFLFVALILQVLSFPRFAPLAKRGSQLLSEISVDAPA